MISKVIVAHPDKQHSFRLATALKQKGILYKYVTTIYDRPSSLTNRIKKLLRGKNLKKASSRSCSNLDNVDVVQYLEWLNLIIVFIARFPFLSSICIKLKFLLYENFGIKVAKYAIRHNVDVVVMYDSTASSCFEYLAKHAPNITRVLDTSTVAHDFMRDTFDRMIEMTRDYTIHEEYPYLWNKKIMNKYLKEIELSNNFLVPSEIVKHSLIYKGKTNIEKIFKVPYGVDTTKFVCPTEKKKNNKLKILFVGQVTCRKGINILMKAIERFSNHEVELFIAGGFNHNSTWYVNYAERENIHYLGFVTRDVISDLFASVDVFVLPSFAEGLALVGLEAMSCGLPIICSQFSGVNDLIEEKSNGLIIDVFDVDSLYNAIKYFINIDSIEYRKMSLNARRIADAYTWNNYEININEVFNGMNFDQK